MLEKREPIYSNTDQEFAPDEGKLIPFINYRKPAPQRALDMLLDKYHGRPYQTEVIMTGPDSIPTPNLRRPLAQAALLLITDGGLVPRGNPDRLPSTGASRFYRYSIEGVSRLDGADYEVSHQGYENRFVEQDPNRLLPVDALRSLEKSGELGRLYDAFLSTTGVMVSTEKSRSLGERIARYVKTIPVDAVLIASACGTSTRCGAYIGLALKKAGIPVVQVTNLTSIAEDVGVNRVLKGSNICYPFGQPDLSPENEYAYRLELVREALQKLEERQKTFGINKI